MNHEFLIILPLPETLAKSVERYLRAGAAFLETLGSVSQRELGRYVRSTRNGSEVLHLVAFLAPVSGADEGALGIARSLEAVLRSALGAAKAPTSDVRVFVEPSSRPEAE
jgi:hypothetical protein